MPVPAPSSVKVPAPLSAALPANGWGANVALLPGLREHVNGGRQVEVAVIHLHAHGRDGPERGCGIEAGLSDRAATGSDAPDERRRGADHVAELIEPGGDELLGLTGGELGLRRSQAER